MVFDNLLLAFAEIANIKTMLLMIVGVGAAREFAGLDVGSSLTMGKSTWEVVGLFEDQGGIAESRAALGRSRADAEAERVRVHTTLFELHQELQHSVHKAEALRDSVIPSFEDAMNETRRGYERGRYPYSELRTVQADLLAARRSFVTRWMPASMR